MKQLLFLMMILAGACPARAQLLPGFKPSGLHNEQQMLIENSPSDTRILINAPLQGFDKDDRVTLVIYALPNGNTIEQTFGKRLKTGDDWHFNIQHIGAQTRYLRARLKGEAIVVAYFESKQKSWPAWKANTPDYAEKVKSAVDEVKAIFDKWHPAVILNGHSGGGRFIFSYIDAFKEIPDDVSRIAFLDSDYGYEDTIYGPKIESWLRTGKKYLCTLAYNDSIALYEGKPFVSATGGTWYRSKMMLKYLSRSFKFRKTEKDSLLWFDAKNKRVEIILKPNPERKIFHTQQVEYNGFIQSMLSGTKEEEKGYSYFGSRAYNDFIDDTIVIPIRRLNIPARAADAEAGSTFMARIDTLPLDQREEEIFKAVASGNIPGFLRNTVTLKAGFADTAGITHKVIYEAMPDYISVGSDDDFCRVPMNPHTAQRIAALFGASLLTSKLSDNIYENAEVKLAPFNYVPVGNANELVSKFIEHNARIEKQLAEAGGHHGQLVAGIKKDVIISARIAKLPGKVVIYGWHRPDGKPIQPVYSGHVDWYVDYSHGIRFINNQIILDGKPVLVTDILKDPLLYKILSDEDTPMEQTAYTSE